MSTKAEMLACLDREIALRKRVYPQWVLQGRMSKVKADEEIFMMQNVRIEIARHVPDDPIVQPSLPFAGKGQP